MSNLAGPKKWSRSKSREMFKNVEHRYDPIFNDEVLTSGRFVASPHVTEFMENADYANGAMADWGTSILYLSHVRHTHTHKISGTGMGTLSVYVDDLLTHERHI